MSIAFRVTFRNKVMLALELSGSASELHVIMYVILKSPFQQSIWIEFIGCYFSTSAGAKELVSDPLPPHSDGEHVT